jgi:hypothetical protein
VFGKRTRRDLGICVDLILRFRRDYLLISIFQPQTKGVVLDTEDPGV